MKPAQAGSPDDDPGSARGAESRPHAARNLAIRLMACLRSRATTSPAACGYLGSRDNWCRLGLV